MGDRDNEDLTMTEATCLRELELESPLRMCRKR